MKKQIEKDDLEATPGPGPCSFDGKTMVLCIAMDKYAKSHGDTERRSAGIYLMDNMVHSPTWTMFNVGPAFKNSAKDPGILFNFCPWCGSDLEKNWRGPVKADKERRIAEKIAEKLKADDEDQTSTCAR